VSTVQTDFDRIALASPEGANHNDLYHDFLLQYLPSNCGRTLDIGCGKGTFSRRLAEQSRSVLALDLSPEMIRLARSGSASFANIDFQLADVMSLDLPPGEFDCVASIATLHHLPLREALKKMKAALKPGGILLILDLYKASGLRDTLMNPVAIAVSVALRLIHHRRLLPPRDVRAAWKAHEQHDIYPTSAEVQSLCHDLLPSAQIKKHLLWRYSIIWQKPALM